VKSRNEAFWSNSTCTFISGTPVTALLILASASVKRPSGERTTAQGGDLIPIIICDAFLQIKLKILI
jgi:hypothetical protein